MLKQFFNGRLFGHPIHIMLIHFPVAFFPLSAALDIISFIKQSSYFAELGFYSSVIGITFGILAAVFGAIDLIKIKNQAVMQKALLHGSLNILWVMIFSTIAMIQYNKFPLFEAVNIWIVIIKFTAVTGIIYSNYLGGDLVLKYGLGKKDINNSA